MCRGPVHRGAHESRHPRNTGSPGQVTCPPPSRGTSHRVSFTQDHIRHKEYCRVPHTTTPLYIEYTVTVRARNRPYVDPLKTNKFQLGVQKTTLNNWATRWDTRHGPRRLRTVHPDWRRLVTVSRSDETTGLGPTSKTSDIGEGEGGSVSTCTVPTLHVPLKSTLNFLRLETSFTSPLNRFVRCAVPKVSPTLNSTPIRALSV